MMDDKELKRRYTYHAPNESTRELHDAVRNMEYAFAVEMDSRLPGDSREKALVLTKLEEAMFWAHAHIARNVHEFIDNRSIARICITCGEPELTGAHI
jgi:signal recognition particle subunit SEC65